MTTHDRDQVIAALRDHIGKANGISGAELTRKVLAKLTASAAEQRALRHTLEALRRDGHHICGHPSTGYYLAANEAELEETCAFLQHRALCSLSQVSAMKRVSIPDLIGQLKLPT